MFRIESALQAACVTFSCFALSACATTDRSADVAGPAPGMHEITALYEKATAHHRRAVRKPVREDRARALSRLAVKADRLAADTQTWESDVKLISTDAADTEAVRTCVAEFRASLTALGQAASSADNAGVRDKYAAVRASYRRLISLTEPAAQ